LLALETPHSAAFAPPLLLRPSLRASTPPLAVSASLPPSSDSTTSHPLGREGDGSTVARAGSGIGSQVARRDGLRLMAGAAILTAAGSEAGALCGGQPGAWEFWVPWEEGAENVKVAAGGSARGVYYRVVGNKGKEKTKVKGKTYVRRPLLVVADKFRSHDYLTTLEAVVTSDRRVVEYDGLGEGLSEPLEAGTRDTLRSQGDAALRYAVEELAALAEPLRKQLKVDGFHVLGHAFGAEVAAEYAKTAPEGMIRSLALAAAPSSLVVPQSDRYPLVLLKDPANLCTEEGSDADREAFVSTVIAFIDSVDGTPTKQSLFT